ncbi:hypothetical protein KAR91_63060 [Candidatus Pacearchaeota archaeon]|nr:hypothetical protein [Candidatus Pacearchaeota archaeon]
MEIEVLTYLPENEDQTFKNDKLGRHISNHWNGMQPVEGDFIQFLNTSYRVRKRRFCYNRVTVKYLLEVIR